MPGGESRRPRCAGLMARLARELKERGTMPRLSELGVGAGELAQCLDQAARALGLEPEPLRSESPPSGGTADQGTWVLNADGGSRGNPGPAGAGAVLYSPDGAEAATVAEYLGETTNNVAEYTALIRGLEKALELGVGRLEVRLDSELVVRQLEGRYKVKSPHLKGLYEQARGLLGRIAAVRLSHVPRAANARADELANQAMDRG